MAIRGSSATLEHHLERRSGNRALSLNPDLPPMEVTYVYDTVNDVKLIGTIIVRLKAMVHGNWFQYEEAKWIRTILFYALTVDEEDFSSGFGFELVLEDLDKSITAEFHKRFNSGTLIYKEKDVERLTEIHPPFEVLPVA